ncbi:MAG: hypothetical protein ACRCXY_04245 [Fusobacteriaceae bacterium]
MVMRLSAEEVKVKKTGVFVDPVAKKGGPTLEKIKLLNPIVNEESYFLIKEEVYSYMRFYDSFVEIANSFSSYYLLKKWEDGSFIMNTNGTVFLVNLDLLLVRNTHVEVTPYKCPKCSNSKICIDIEKYLSPYEKDKNFFYTCSNCNEEVPDSYFEEEILKEAYL